MEDDYTLVGKAAAAAGLQVQKKTEVVDDDLNFVGIRVRKNWNDRYRVWNPLTDDGDALRLAVQCGIEVSIVDDEPGNDGRTSRACAGYTLPDDPRVRYVFEDHRGDIFAATRRAIVRAAAALA